MATYLVERFLVSWTANEVRTLLDDVAAASSEFERRGMRHLESIVVPDHEACWSVYDELPGRTS